MSATALELQRDRWVAYFNLLSKEYQGWATTIELLASDLGDQTIVDRLPLQGISFETKGSAAGDVLVEVGDIGQPYETHRINRPRVVRVADTQPGAELDIQIESEDGSSRLIHLRRYQELPAPGTA